MPPLGTHVESEMLTGRTNTFRLGATVMLALGALAIGGCGRSTPAAPAERGTTSLSTPKAPLGATAWAKSACTALGGWLDDMKARGKRLSSLATADDPIVVHEQLLKFLDGAVASSTTTHDYLVRLGIPTSKDNSKERAESIVAQVTQVRDLLSAARDRVKAADPADQDALARSTRDIAAVLTQGVAAAEVGGAPETPTDLDKAFESVDQCLELGATT